MGLIDESRVNVDTVTVPIIKTNRLVEPIVKPVAPAPKVDRDWRTEEIRQLRAAICRHAPPRDDEYWEGNLVWVGCTDAFLDKTAGTGDFVKLVFKAETKDDSDDIWEYYESRKAEILAAIRLKAPAANIRIVETKIEKGSVTIFVLIQITIGLGVLIVAILGNYDNIEKNFKRALPHIKQYVTDTIVSLKRFFGGFGFGAA